MRFRALIPLYLRAAVVGFQNAVYFISCRHDVRKGNVVVHKINEGSDKLAHIGFDKIRSCVKLGRQIGEVCRHDLVKVPRFICGVKGFQPVCEKTKGAADEYAAGIHFL